MELYLWLSKLHKQTATFGIFFRSNRSEGSKSSKSFIPNTVRHAVRNVRMFFTQRNCIKPTKSELCKLTRICSQAKLIIFTPIAGMLTNHIDQFNHALTNICSYTSFQDIGDSK